MPQYLSPGVYVEEIPSAVQAIAGVSTSTAGFIGILPDEVTVPTAELSSSNRIVDEQIDPTTSTDGGATFQLANYPVDTSPSTFTFEATDAAGQEVQLNSVTVRNNHETGTSTVEVDPQVTAGTIQVSYHHLADKVTNETVGFGDGKNKQFRLANYPVVTVDGTYTVTITNADGSTVDPTTMTISLRNNSAAAASFLAIDPAPDAKATVRLTYNRYLATFIEPDVTAMPKLCTNFGDFRRTFGGFSTDISHRNLAHAVFGFFNNGGTRCYVVGITGEAGLDLALERLGAVDEVALVAAPGMVDAIVRDKIVTNCKIATQDRFAIFDSPEVVETNDVLDLTLFDPSNTSNILPDNSDYAAFYFPWLQVFDPATKIQDPKSDGRIYVPPSGHMAGIYAYVDNTRGFHKAPANVAVRGALDLKYQISKAQQDGLNPQGVNCIRDLNGNKLVWGARTIGGDANGEWRYINVRRTFLFLRESIDEGTQWAVFEPNDEKLWAKITRNITAFLTTVWRSGALFGSSPDQAFYVKCNAETNPPELREVGQVVTEIGVAVVKPAEFVIFRISQWQPEQ